MGSTTKDAIREWTSDLAENDPFYYEEWLTKTDGGQFIICGCGNENSPYASMPGEKGGSGVQFVTEEMAQKWLANHPEKALV